MLTSLRTQFACILLSLGAAAGAHAQTAVDNWPQRPIKILVGFPPGGSTDGAMRVMAEMASKRLGTSIVIENKPGASGTLPVIMLQTAPADGYTLGIATQALFRLPYTVGVKWDPIEDLTYLIGVSEYAFAVAVRTDSPLKTWADYLAHAKLNPKALSFGSPGATTATHLMMERISRSHGIELNHIPYKGSSENIQALLGGHVDSIADTPTWGEYVNAGRVRLLVTGGTERMTSFSTVPTLTEVGTRLVNESAWGIVGPKGLPPAIAKKLHDAFEEAVKSERFQKNLANFFVDTKYMNSADYKSYAIGASVREKAILEELNVLRK